MIDYDAYLVPSERRKAIVERNTRSIAHITCERLKTGGELSYAMRYLADHYTYKRSKSGGVKKETLIEVVTAFRDAASSYMMDVAEPHGVTPETMDGPEASEARPVSQLGEGQIVNPWNFR